MPASRSIMLGVIGFLLLVGVTISVFAISTTSMVQPSKPHMVKSAPAEVVENDHDADDLVEGPVTSDQDTDD